MDVVVVVVVVLKHGEILVEGHQLFLLTPTLFDSFLE